MTAAEQHRRFLTILCFGLVYFFWGSTYLAIDIAVGGIPPALMCAIRFLIAGALMLAYARLTGENIRYSRDRLAKLAVIGVLLLTGGNMTLAYAEQYVPTGLASLLIASIPLWMILQGVFLLEDHHLPLQGIFGLALGVCGTFVLLWPQLHETTTLGRKELLFSLALLAGSFSWGLGSVLTKRWKTGSSLSTAGWQVSFAGLACLLFATLRGDMAHGHWPMRSLLAVAYLIVCGSLIGYTAYIWLLGHVTTSKVSTYAYVNPIVAVFLGWIVLHEHVDRFILAGSFIVIVSVVLVNSAAVKTKSPVAVAAETGAD
jgi:drug/metabolite transporter (DMT)-like permease